MSYHKRELLESARREAEAGKFRATSEAIRADGGALIEAWTRASRPGCRCWGRR